MVSIAKRNMELAGYAGPGHWNDPDMLEVSNGDKAVLLFNENDSAADISVTAAEAGLNKATGHHPRQGVRKGPRTHAPAHIEYYTGGRAAATASPTTTPTGVT